jgi:two-component system OmpR family response regulator
MKLHFKTRVATPAHRILVVDDYPDGAEVMCILLGILGHECRAVYTGRDALAEASVFEPDIVILDLGLPDISGYEVARELRRRGSSNPVHIAACTGWGDAAAIARSVAAGLDQHVVKPIDRAKLSSMIKFAERSHSSTMLERTFEQPA